MIKLTHIPASSPEAPALFLIPGGPGLSSGTLRSLDVLARSLHLYYVDFPGTNGISYERDFSFAELTSAITVEIGKIGRRSFIFGHSFGGFWAAEGALSAAEVVGLICAATPFSKISQAAASANYAKAVTPNLAAAEALWNDSPSDATFANWLASYDRLYFSSEDRTQGAELIMRDACSANLFQALRSEAQRMEAVLARLRGWDGKKLSIVGAADGILSASALVQEASMGEFELQTVPHAGHFVMFDQPESVAGLIERFCATDGRNS